MNHILQKEFSPQCSEEPLHKRLTPVELAIGWPNGLQRLLEVGYYADFGLRLSIYIIDLGSTNIILAAEKFPRDMNAWNPVLTDLKTSNRKIKQVVIQTFLRRRQALANFAIKELPEEAIVRLGLLNGKIIDAAAPKVYEELQMLNIHIPLRNLAQSYISDQYFSIYHFFFDLYDSGPVPSRRLLDLFYENGSDLVDTLDPYMESPLFLACKGFIGRSWSSRQVRLIRGPDISYILPQVRRLRKQNGVPRIFSFWLVIFSYMGGFLYRLVQSYWREFILWISAPKFA